jgi:hypothetical protein
MLAPIIFDESETVDARLAALDLDQQVLIDALVQANMYFVRLTSHHPLLYRYGVLTAETVAALRDFLVPRGWEVRNEGNYELVFNPKLNMSIAVASGNEATGDRLRVPSNKSEKGPRTAKAVKDNQTADLFPETVPTVPESIVPADTWILLHHRCASAIRLELSRPNGFDDTERFVTGWSERILLGAISLDNDPMPMLMPQLPEDDILITRKAA